MNQYGPNRIPGYLNSGQNDTLVLYGHVMRELTTRICARQIAQSNILVVSPEAPNVVNLLQQTTIETDNQETALRRKIQHSVGGSTLIHAHRQGHDYHGYATLNNQWKDQEPPGWILLAMFDSQWENDNTMQQAISLLQQSTVTYIVLGIGASPNNNQVYGQDAISHLLDLKYKVQILSQSHAPTQLSRNKLMSPNSLITKQTLHLVFDSMIATAKASGRSVHGYIFATQGLDLAIPTSTAYSPNIGTYGIQYRKCPTTNLEIQFYNQNSKRRSSKIRASNSQPNYKVTCQGQPFRQQNTTSNIWMTSSIITTATTWLSAPTIEDSEAVCIRLTCGGQRKSACSTRVLPKPLPAAAKTKQKPNLLLLMMDPISRARFERSLVKTNRLIQLLNFTSFSQYTAVGNNSGPNQAALYSGKPLESRQSIANHNKQHQQWLWETLKQAGYATFKAENGCVENSNMIQSIQPQVDHGDALLQMMCFDFQRPNCIGSMPAAQHLIQHAQQFIDAYQSQGQAWAAMLHFIDSHEDTQMLEGTLDDPIWRFLYQFYHSKQCPPGVTSKEECPSVYEDTMVVLLSDHGLHYGSYLLSPQGLKERSQPMLHFHLPKHYYSVPEVRDALQTNQQLHTTPFDVYETLLEVLVPETLSNNNKAKVGSTLLKPLPTTRQDCATTNGIPSYVCDILRDSQPEAIMPGPPSIMSFYADIPFANKVTRPRCEAKPDNSTIFQDDMPCLCATSHRKWHPCTEHPWAKPSPQTKAETFALVDCVDERSFEIQVQRDPKIVQRTKKIASKRKTKKNPPNILFIEVDSVSTAYADRHMPLTRELLDSLRLQKTIDGGYTCQGDERLCAVEFDKATVVGPNSIPNQVAVFGACIVTVGPERCEQLQTDRFTNRTLCANATSPVYGMELTNRLRTSATFCPVDPAKRSPWIFDIAKSAGYVTLFSEEFCYEGSIYVPQNAIFPLQVDVEPGKLFCQTARLRAKREEIPGASGRPPWLYAYRSSSGEPNCVHKDGGYEAPMVPLDHVSTMWDSYHDTPKFAYVNAISAHEYAEFRFMAEKSEVYDSILSSFLKQMMARKDATNTIIVLRADHGLQAGPMTIDYSIQIEALRPWTQLIVPKTLQGMVLEKLFDNQQRLVTGFDLYKTLTATMVGEETGILPKPPSWTAHLWRESVSKTRTCKEATGSNDYCLFEGQRTFTSPNLRSCNLVEDDQQLVCPLMANEFVQSMSEIVPNSFYTTMNLQEKVCPSKALDPAIPASVASVWRQLDKAAEDRAEPTPEQKSYPLPPRQVSILTSIVADLSDAVNKTEKRPLNICQTGFGQGHSAALFMDVSPNVHLHTFARLNHTTQTPYFYFIQSMKGNAKRMKLHKCDSCLSMLDYQRREKGISCDIIHGFPPTAKGYADPIVDLVKKAPCGVILSSPATKNLEDSGRLYFGGDNQWAKLRERECIEDIRCFEEDGKPTQKFCLAVTTGKCQHPQPESIRAHCNDSPIAALSRRIVLSQICPAHEVSVPPTLKQPSTSKAPEKSTVKKLVDSAVKGAVHKLTALEKRTKNILGKAKAAQRNLGEGRWGKKEVGKRG